MTTPAVNFTAHKHCGPGKTMYRRPWDPNLIPGATGGLEINGILSRKRGKSVSSTYYLGGRARLPTVWYHEGGYRPHVLNSHHETGEIAGTDRYGTVYSGGYANGTDGLRFAAFKDSVYDRAINGLLSDVKNSKVNLAQAFAERQQTVDLVTSVALRVGAKISAFRAAKGKKWWKKFTQIAKAQPRYHASTSYAGQGLPPASFYRRRNHGGAGRRSPLTKENITSDWLAFQYGVKPLLDDAYGALAKLNEAEMADAGYYRSHVEVKKGERVSEERTDLFWLAACKGAVDPILRLDTFDGCSAAVWFTVENELLASLSSLGITNPQNLAWELLPFSFVADWFIPVGNYLNLMDATLGWKFMFGSVSKVQKLEASIVGARQKVNLFNQWSDKYVIIDMLEKAKARMFKFERSLILDWPRPRLPKFKNPITLGHFANASALLVALFK